MAHLLSVDEAGADLGVSSRQIRKMLADRQLVGHQIGRAWVIERHELDRFRNERASVGRPWNPGSAWAVLAVANGDEPKGSPVDRSRARKRLAERGLSGLSAQLRRRAEVMLFYAHPSVFERLADEQCLVRSGISAVAEYAADVVASESFEAYVADDEFDGVVSNYSLDAGAERPNVVLRVVDHSVWPFPPGAQFAPRPVVAVDLLDAGDERSRRAGLLLAKDYWVGLADCGARRVPAPVM